MRVAVYCRIATASQTDAGYLAIQAQQDVLITYAYQNNFEIAKVYADIGYKGHDLMRPGFCEMIKDAKQGMFDAILVKNPGRIFRGNAWVFPELPVPVIFLDLQNFKQKNTYVRRER